MNTRDMTCEQFADGLADFLERDMTESSRAAMESHAVSCDDCGPLLADLRHLRLSAANLPELVPSRDLWAGISARIETPVVELGGRAAPGGRVDGWTGGRRRRERLWLGVAAAALIAVTAGVTYQATRLATRSSAVAVTTATPAHLSDSAPRATLTSPATTVASAEISRPPVLPSSRPPEFSSTRPPGGGAAGAAPARLASNNLSPEQTYDREIVRLKKIVNARRSVLDTATVGVVERNLHIIDQAIAQCRAALKKDPGSRFLMESLDEALDNKVELLRTAAALPIGS